MIVWFNFSLPFFFSSFFFLYLFFSFSLLFYLFSFNFLLPLDFYKKIYWYMILYIGIIRFVWSTCIKCFNPICTYSNKLYRFLHAIFLLGFCTQYARNAETTRYYIMRAFDSHRYHDFTRTCSLTRRRTIKVRKLLILTTSTYCTYILSPARGCQSWAFVQMKG